MVENNDLAHNSPSENITITPSGMMRDVAAGFGMGVAFIIPGFSGGSVAAILGIYERLVGAIADIFRDFKRSIITLIPIFIGLCLGAVSLLYPLSWALDAFPLPTVSLFVGLSIGGMFSITNKVNSPFGIAPILSFVIPTAVAASLSFIPSMADVDLFSLDPFGYLILFFIGMLASCALVIPGISGSMILLILGYYNPIIKVITENFLRGENFLSATLILMTVGLGIVVGFISISKVMKKLLSTYPSLTYIAIIGFISGSIPSVFISAANEAGYTLSGFPTDSIYWISCILALLIGFVLSLMLVIFASRKDKTA